MNPTDARRHSSDVARRLGPVLAVVGLLGAVAVLVWVAVAPDNVVGAVATGDVTVPAVAIAAGDGDGCVVLVAGDGSHRDVCGEVALDAHWTTWTDAGRLAVTTAAGTVVVDPADGTVVSDGASVVDQADTPSRSDQRAFVDGTVVRTGRDGRDGPVVLDLGAPVGRLRDASISPDGDWAVAVDRDGRVLVARSEVPTEVHEWFRIDPDDWLDLSTAVRWAQ